MLLETILPEYHKREYHEISIRGSSDGAYDALKSLDFSASPAIRNLFRLRGMPAASIRLADLERMGFLVAAEDPPREIVLGFIGKFWTPTGQMQRLDAARYLAFDREGFAKGAWNFFIHDSDSDSFLLSTETRVHCTDRRSRRYFGWYWFVIHRFSAWTRREALRLVKRRIEGRERAAGDAGRPASE